MKLYINEFVGQYGEYEHNNRNVGKIDVNEDEEYESEYQWITEYVCTAYLDQEYTNPVGFVQIYSIDRQRMKKNFYALMDEPSQEFIDFAFALFDNNGELKPKLKNKVFSNATKLNKGPLGLIEAVVVYPEYRRKGYGTQMLDQVMKNYFFQYEKCGIVCAEAATIRKGCEILGVPMEFPEQNNMSEEEIKTFRAGLDIGIQKLLRKAGFRRIHETPYFGTVEYDSNKNHPCFDLEAEDVAVFKPKEQKVLSEADQRLKDNVVNGNLVPLQTLVVEGYLDLKTKNEINLLQSACGKKDNMAMVEYLLQQGMDINAQDENGITALHVAASAFNLKLVHYLLGKGADKGIQNSQGMTPAEVAVEQNESADEFSSMMDSMFGDIELPEGEKRQRRQENQSRKMVIDALK